MPLDLFISYAVEDKLVADAICSALEANGIRCWMAPRDIDPGSTWAEAIVKAIQGTRIMVVVFSGHSNNSQQVVREVSEAVSRGNIIIPFRIEDIVPSMSLHYFFSTPHWLDALTPPLEHHINKLVASVKKFTSDQAEPPVWSAAKEPEKPALAALEVKSEGE